MYEYGVGMGGSSNLKRSLQRLDSYDFEHLIADLWEDRGWQTQVLQESNDRGVDVDARRADPFEQKHLIQAKRYADGNTVGSQEVQQYASLRQQENNVDAVIIVTTSEFTRQAEEIAADVNLKLIDGDELVRMIHEQNATDIVKKYISEDTTGATSQESTTQQKKRQSPHTLDINGVPDIYISKLVDNAHGDLVTKNRLAKLKSGMSHPKTPTEKPILGHLFEDEQPHFTLRSPKVRLPEQGVLKPKHNAYLVATDQRVLIILGTKQGDETFSMPYQKISGVEPISGFTGEKIELETSMGTFRFKLDHTHLNESQASSEDDIKREVNRCAQYIREAVYSLM